MKELQIHNKAPNFVAASSTDKEIELKQLLGQNVVLYFYPKDDTPGCTIEANDFNHYLPEFEELDTIIIGISKDNVVSHKKFCDKYSLNFPLLSDVDKKICILYGVLKEKSMFGKKYMGINRTTYIIDKKGNIAHIFNNVKVKGHVNKVIEKLKNMNI